MDRTLALLQNADPADPAPDSAELIQLEGTELNDEVDLLQTDGCFLTLCFCKYVTTGACEQMNPMIDERLQEIDR